MMKNLHGPSQHLRDATRLIYELRTFPGFFKECHILRHSPLPNASEIFDLVDSSPK